MAQLAVAAGGALIGGQFGQAGLGFFAGSILGAWLFAPNTTQRGPRLEDLTIQTSTYGTPIALGFGSPRAAGNIIWSDGIKEHRNKKKVGGKGGPRVTQISYTYTVNLAIAFFGRGSDKLIKLFADTKLIHDASSTSDTPNSQELPYKLNLRFYNGSETQEPDPLIESILGIGNVPAYRGITYIVIEDFPLEDFGNRIPNFQAEISFNAEDKYPLIAITPSDTTIAHGGFNSASSILIDPNRPYMYCFDNASKYIMKINTITNEVIDTNELLYVIEPQTVGTVDEDGYVWMQMYTGGSHNIQPIYRIDNDTLDLTHRVGYQSIFSGWERIAAFAQMFPIKFPVRPGGGLEKIMVVVSLRVITQISIFSREMTYIDDSLEEKFIFYGQYQDFIWTDCACIDRNNTIWGITGYPINAYLSKTKFSFTVNDKQNTTQPGSSYQAKFEHTKVVKDFKALGYFYYANYICYNEDDHSLLIFGRDSTNITQGLVLKYDIESDSVISTLNTGNLTMGSWRYEEMNQGPKNGKIFISNVAVGGILDVNKMEIIGGPYVWNNWTVPKYGAVTIHEEPHYYDLDSHSVFMGGQPDSSIGRYYLDRNSSGSESLQAVVEYLCQKCNLTITTDVNATSLASETVYAYTVGRLMSGVDAIKALIPAYFFRGYQSDWKLIFKLLTGSSSFAISEDDLGIESSDKLREMFIQEQELPIRVNITCLNREKDYEEITQTEKRTNESTESRQIYDYRLPLGFNEDECKKIAEKTLYRSWIENTGLEISLNWEWIRLDPVDIGTITIDDVVYTARINNYNFGANMSLNLELIKEDLETLESLAEGYSGDGIPDKEISSYSPTEVILFDVPLLRDQDASGGSGPVIYAAAYGYSEDWSGGVIFTSNDGIDYSDVEFINIAPIRGVLTTKLTESINWATWDRFKEFTVNIQDDESLSSVTENQVLTNYANAALIESNNGWEVVQFANVTDHGDGTFTCKTLLRGRRGTDTFQNHSIGSKFFLLDPDTFKKILAENSMINSFLFYKGVSVGSVVSDTPDFSIKLNANSYKPWTVSDVRSSRDGSNNLTVTWERRTRYAGQMLDGIGIVPLNEDSESYEVDILDNSESVLRTIDSTSETVSYTAAEQSADGLTPGDDISIIIYQLSSYVGRGFGKEVIV